LRIRSGKASRFVFSLLLLARPAFGEGTRMWEQSKFDELAKGTTQGVAIRSRGGLELAPAFKSLTTTPATYIWSIAVDPSGRLYAATGAPARVYQITPDSQTMAIFQPQELQVQSLVIDKRGVVYAATNPDGKVYKLEHHAPMTPRAEKDTHGNLKDKAKSDDASEWTSSIYFDPGTKYIWDLLLDDSGNLFVATGDHGEIFRVAPGGEHSLFFKSDESHIRTLAIDSHGNLIAGSDGSGLIYRISRNGEGFVLYSAPKKEITALAIDPAGDIYAAGVGEKHSSTGSNFPIVQVTAQSATPLSPEKPGNPTNAPTSAPLVMGGLAGAGANSTGGSEIYRIAPDDSPTRVWTSHDDLIYSLAFSDHGHLLAGTGNKGHIFAIDGEDEYTDLLKTTASQVTAFANAPNGGLYAATSNLGKIFLLGASSAEAGTYESDVFDAHIFSRWGRAEFRGEGNVELFARSGNVDNPDRNWSPWRKIDAQKDAEVSAPPARFVQWKAVLKSGDPGPRLDSMALNYLPKNVAPDFDEVTVQIGVRYPSLPKPSAGDSSGSSGSNQAHFEAPPPAIHDRSSIGVKWTVHDENEDEMIYSVYYRGDKEQRWLLLKGNITDKFYSFDASLLPDGGYTVKILASDAPSHSPHEALTAERESARFEVDTTPPQIENLHASEEQGRIHVAFRATDSFSSIKRAEYSVDAGDWQFIEPVDQLSDARTDSYDFQAAGPRELGLSGVSASNIGGDKTPAAQLEHIVVVRVYDHYDNMNSAKTVLRGK
jgi:WD40 repeat protein